MGIEEALECGRLSIQYVSRRDFPKQPSPSHFSIMHDMIVMRLVGRWLKRAGVHVDTDIPRTVGDYFLGKKSNGVVVIRNGEAIHEYDYLIPSLCGKPAVVEVKSGALNGYMKKIPRARSLGATIYGLEPSLILFAPLRHKGSLVAALRGEGVTPICLDYGPNDLQYASQRVFGKSPAP